MTQHQHVHVAPANDPTVLGFFRRLLDTDFVPRGECVAWRPEIVWTHVVSDALIALAYYSIPLALLYFIRKRGDLAYRWMFAMFAGFILACGTTHLMSIIAFWHPLYRLDGLIKAATATISIITAGMLWPLIPRAAALPSPTQLRKANEELEAEVTTRRRVEEDLRQAHAEMENRVTQRTSELAAINRELQDEIAHRRAQERHKSFLLAELDHRVKNTLAMILSLSEESLRNASSMDEFSTAFSGRVRALARTHSTLAAAKWTSIPIAGLVRAAVEACDLGPDAGTGGRVLVDGPDVQLSSKAATTVCLALHELATNASKYGAFSTSRGRVEVRWRIEPNSAGGPSRLHLTWTELDGPAVAPPTRRGLGTVLIEGGIAYELGGSVAVDYRTEGVVCTIDVPLTAQNTQRGHFEAAASVGDFPWPVPGATSHDGQAHAANNNQGDPS